MIGKKDIQVQWLEVHLTPSGETCTHIVKAKMQPIKYAVDLRHAYYQTILKLMLAGF